MAFMGSGLPLRRALGISKPRIATVLSRAEEVKSLPPDQTGRIAAASSRILNSSGPEEVYSLTEGQPDATAGEARRCRAAKRTSS
jgi:hypothetical protein